jgi:hypothetical protein
MRRRGSPSILAALLTGLLALCSAACGVPTDGSARVIEPSRVPYDLLDSRPATTPGPATSGPAVVRPQVYFLDAEERPVPRSQPLDTSDLEGSVSGLLSRLAAGPTDQERAAGLSSALGPGVGLDLLDVTERVARISVVPSEQTPTADRLPLAIAQVVFTATSAEGVDRIQLLRRGRTIEVPLPGGARTSAPVGAGDYLELLTGSPEATPLP